MSAENETQPNDADEKAKRSDGWNTVNDWSQFPAREPGPIQVNRHVGSHAFQGLGTLWASPSASPKRI